LLYAFIVQRNKVEDQSKKLQVLVDNEIQDISFTSYSDSQEVLFTDDIFQKQKRVREEDVIGKQSSEFVLEVESSQYPPSFVQMVE
jgi:hypothetical protein